MAKDDKNKMVRLSLTEADHLRLRMAAAQSNVSMATFAQRAVKRAVDEVLPPVKGTEKKRTN